MRIAGIHILKDSTLRQKIQEAREHQRALSSALVARLLHINHLWKEKLDSIKQ